GRVEGGDPAAPGVREGGRGRVRGGEVAVEGGIVGRGVELRQVPAHTGGAVPIVAPRALHVGGVPVPGPSRERRVPAAGKAGGAVVSRRGMRRRRRARKKTGRRAPFSLRPTRAQPVTRMVARARAVEPPLATDSKGRVPSSQFPRQGRACAKRG